MDLCCDPKDEIWSEANWAPWSTGTFAEDQGGEGVAGYHALVHKDTLRANAWEYWEWSRSCNNDFDIVYDAVGKKDVLLLMLVVHNINHGHAKDPGMHSVQQKMPNRTFSITTRWAQFDS